MFSSRGTALTDVDLKNTVRKKIRHNRQYYVIVVIPVAVNISGRVYDDFYEQDPELPWGLYGPAHVDTIVCMRNDAALVSKRWREQSRIAQLAAIKAVRAAFFAEVVAKMQRVCVDPSTLATQRHMLLLRYRNVTHTVVKVSMYADWSPPQCDVALEHYPVDDTQRQVPCFPPNAHGRFVYPPAGYNVKHRIYKTLDTLPHFRVPDKDRTAAQKAEAQTWLTGFGQTVLQSLWHEFDSLNNREWHRQRFRVGAEETRKRKLDAVMFY